MHKRIRCVRERVYIISAGYPTHVDVVWARSLSPLRLETDGRVSRYYPPLATPSALALSRAHIDGAADSEGSETPVIVNSVFSNCC